MGLYKHTQTCKLNRWTFKCEQTFARSTYLGSHVVVGGAVEVLVGPFAESLLTKLSCRPVVLERELSVRLKESGLLHCLC